MPRDVISEVIPDEVSEVLLRAADLIEKGGHCLWTYRDGTAHCTFDAIATASGCEGGGYSLFDKQKANDGAHVGVRAVKRFEAFVGEYICDWNNQKAKDAAHVVSTLRASAVRSDV